MLIQQSIFLVKLQSHLSSFKIQQLLSPKETNWEQEASIAIAIQEQKLYQQQGYNSFTTGVDRIAKKMIMIIVIIICVRLLLPSVRTSSLSILTLWVEIGQGRQGRQGRKLIPQINLDKVLEAGLNLMKFPIQEEKTDEG